MAFVIKWKENGDTFEKEYDSKAGLQYRRRSIIKKFGASAIISESQIVGEGKEAVELATSASRQRDPMLGPVDPYLAIMGAGDNVHRPTLHHSNWNHRTRSYTSRMYGKDFGRGVRVVEPDGSVSLEGERGKVIKTTIKGSYLQILSDGRVFDPFGWPVAPNEESISKFAKYKAEQVG